MNCDLSKEAVLISPPAEVRVVTSGRSSAEANGYPAPEAPDLGGYVSFGTVASGNASGVSEYIVFTPREGNIPHYDLELDNLVRIKSLDAEIFRK